MARRGGSSTLGGRGAGPTGRDASSGRTTGLRRPLIAQGAAGRRSTLGRPAAVFVNVIRNSVSAGGYDRTYDTSEQYGRRF